MSTLIDKPRAARHRNGKIHVEMESGLEPDLDEDLSIRGILAGDYGQRPRVAA